MTAATPLSYFTEDPAVPRRSGTVTAVAVIGIALAGLTIVAQALGATAVSLPRGGGLTALGIAFVVGRFVRVAFTLVMLVGCVGLLSPRPGARWLVIVAAYAWLVFFALEVTTFAYSLLISRYSRLGPLGLLGLSALISLMTGVAYPLFALIMLRRRGLPDALAARSQPAAELPAVVRPVAAILLGFAAIWTLQAAVEWLVAANHVGGSVATLRSTRLLTANNSELREAVVVDATLSVFLYAALGVGCGLLVARRRVGVPPVVIACLAKLALTITAWGSMPGALYTAGFRGGPKGIVLVQYWVSLFSTQVTPLVWPTLVLLIVSTGAPPRPPRRRPHPRCRRPAPSHRRGVRIGRPPGARKAVCSSVAIRGGLQSAKRNPTCLTSASAQLASPSLPPPQSSSPRRSRAPRRRSTTASGRSTAASAGNSTAG